MIKKIRVRTLHKVVIVSALVVTGIFLAGYSAGLRLTAFTPGNLQVCSDTVDYAPDYTPAPRTAEEQAEFEKYCPNFFWGEWDITKPDTKKGWELVGYFSFWRPYWGVTWPDNNLGVYGPQPKPTN